jgi:hypothetical protein
LEWRNLLPVQFSWQLGDTVAGSLAELGIGQLTDSRAPLGIGLPNVLG